MSSTPKVAGENQTLAVVALVCGICGLLPLLGFAFGLTALITGCLVLIRRLPGRGLALAGVITGVVTLLLNALLVFVVVALFFVRPSGPVTERRALPPMVMQTSQPVATNGAPEQVRDEASTLPVQAHPMHAPVSAHRAEPLPALAPEKTAALLADLQSGETRRLIPATMQLMRTQPAAPDAALAKALTVVLLENENRTLQINAARALENWGTADSLPALHKAAADPNRLLQTHAKKAIASITAAAP